MNILYNAYRQAEAPNFYLAEPGGQIICPLNGIAPSSVRLTMNLNDTADLSFTYENIVDVYGMKIPSNGYHLLDEFMRIYVDHVGWFIMSAPQISNNGNSESKEISARSVDIELTNLDLTGFKINCGTSDSAEMLDSDNVDYIEDVPFAKSPVHFYDPEHPSLSLLHLALNFAGVEGWSIGYVDEIPKVYRSYREGELVEELIQLKDEVGTFDIDSKSVYAFLTQDVEQFFECMILFDIKTMTINAYRPEHLGKDTNITVGFRNLQNSNDISVDKDSIYTRYRVQGDDGLGIGYVNFGSNMIENLSYFLNTRYMDEELIAKYQAWHSDVELKRYEYMEYVRQYNTLLNVLSELLNRVPLKDSSSETEPPGGEDGAMGLPDMEEVEIPDWNLCGINELSVYLEFYRTKKDGLVEARYDLPYVDYMALSSTEPETYPAHTREMHEEMHAQYLDVMIQLNPEIAGSCAHAYEERTQEYEAQEALMEEALAAMEALTSAVDKKNWQMEGVDAFTPKELRTLSKLYRDTDYVNNHMFLLNSDDQVSAIDEQLKLFDAAVLDLEASSQPQYVYRTDLDNFLTLYDYREYTDNLELGDFLYLGTTDDTLVKLRLISYSYNPLEPSGSLSIDFSNMIRTGGKRYDATYLLGLGGNTSKNRISGSSGGFSSNEGLTLTPSLLEKILSSSVFQGNLANKISRHFNAIMGQLVVAKNLETEMIHTVELDAENGFFQYLQSRLIAADKIVSDSAVIRQLSALTANIRDAIIGTSAIETGIVVRLTADNAVIDEAFIKEVMANYITVNDLKAGNIDTNRIHIVSEDGTLTIIGNTQQFKDKNGKVRIQIGEDENGNFTFIVYDQDGEGVLLDQDGIHASAISDGLIKGSMIAEDTIASRHVDWNSCGASTDENGNPIWNAANISINDKGLDIQFSSILNSLDDLETQMHGVQSTVDGVNQSITNKVWRDDIISVTDESGNTISKSILTLLVEHNVSLNGITSTVKDMQGNLTQVTTELGSVTARVENAEGDVSELKAAAEGLTVEISDAKENLAGLEVRADGLDSAFETADGRISTLEQTADGLTSKVASKQDIPLSSIRYIRDWLNGSNSGASNEWVECQVMAGENNIASEILPELYKMVKDENGKDVPQLIELEQDMSVYTDGKLLPEDSAEETADTGMSSPPYIFTENSGPQFMLLDLGGSYSIDSITVWHYYTDNRIYDHKLEVSSDGVNWNVLYTSLISGGYQESSEGRVYYLCDNVMERNFSSMKQDLTGFSMQVSGIEKNMNNFETEITQQLAELKFDMNRISTSVSNIENGVEENKSTITQTSDKWEALFQELGMIKGGETYITLSSKGLEVSNPANGSKTCVTIDGIQGLLEDKPVFSVTGDLTTTKRILIENGLDTTTIKYVPITYTLEDGTTLRALAHVKSGGTS